MDTNVYTHSKQLNLPGDTPRPNVSFPIKSILMDNIDFIRDLDASGKARPCVLDNVEKLLLCGSIYLGYDVYECPSCKNEIIVPHRCHSRLCSSCGTKYAQILSANVSAFAINVYHRHIVFTIPKELRIFFLKDRKLLNLLFVAVRNTICALFNKSLFLKIKHREKKYHTKHPNSFYLYKNYKDTWDFGMIASLHTFGRDLKWNPHIHALVPELAFHPIKDKIKSFHHFDYKKMRLTFQFELLRLLEDALGPSFKSLKNKLYQDKSHGFYVYAKSKYDKSSDDEDDTDYSDDINGVLKYCIRYAARPAMAESRIDDYLPHADLIQWHFDDHKDNQRHSVVDTAHDFIKKLIIHIPDTHFKMIRFYGFYANAASKKLDRVHELLDDLKHSKIKHSRKYRKKKKYHAHCRLRFRSLKIDTFHIDPIQCRCGEIMIYAETYDPLRGKHNDRCYRENCINEMQRLRARRKSSFMGSG